MFIVLGQTVSGMELVRYKIQWLPEAMEKAREAFGVDGVAQVLIMRENR